MAYPLWPRLSPPWRADSNHVERSSQACPPGHQAGPTQTCHCADDDANQSQPQQADPFDLAFFTCLTTIFYTVAWVGQFTIQRLDSFNPEEHITWNGMQDDTDHNSLHTKVFSLPHTKSSPSGVTICGRDILFSILHLPPLSYTSPYTFTVSVIFYTDTYWYVVW